MKKKIITLLLIGILLPGALFADDFYLKSQLFPKEHQSLSEQLGLKTSTLSIPQNAEAIAMGSSDYPVTPGDIYTITYYTPSATGTSYVMNSQNLVVDAKNNISIPYLGLVDATGMTFFELKQFAESQMRMFYSYLNPQLTITRCGTFHVYVSGEVICSTDVTVWSFTKLTDLCCLATDYASSRTVEITYPDNKVKTFDLLKACLMGDLKNNPYVEPGIKVRFLEAETTVYISGAVKTPGQYQIKSDETIADLLQFAKGFTFDADTSSVLVSSFSNGDYECVTIDWAKNRNFILKNMDTVTVKSLSENPSSISIVGAVENGKINYNFVKGETALQVISSIKDHLVIASNLEGVYVERGLMNLYATPENDIVLQAGDTIMVPYKKQTITVSGAVQKPGNYNYEPGRNAQYYIDLAGGFTTDAKQKTLQVLTEDGTKTANSSQIFEDYTISVDRRNTNTANNITLGISLTSLAITLFSAIMSNFK